MTNRTYKEYSRLDFVIDAESNGTEAQVKLGALQRIADATEMMAKNNAGLLRDRDYWKGEAEFAQRERDHAKNQNRALKGAITKLQRAATAKAST